MREWKIGDVFVLRHAGFPFDWLEELGLSAATLALIDQVLDCERALIDGARGSGGEKAAARVRIDLEAGRSPQGKLDAALLSRWSEARKAAAEAIATEKTTLRQRLHTRASEPLVQEAVFLSSPDMFENLWARYVANAPGAENADARRVERQVYSYLQRLCAKNETAGFFGPMGYGEVDDGEGIRVERHPMKRRTLFAYSAVKDLAQAITADKEIWIRLPLRLNPIFRLERDELICPSANLRVALSPPQRQLVAAVRQSGELKALTQSLQLTDRDLLALGMPLFKTGAILRELPWRAADLEAFTSLLDALRTLLPSDAAKRWIERLEALDALRADFERSDLAGKRKLLPALEAKFTELTGKPARRGEGKMYADRLVVYEEASSTFGLKFGHAFARELGEKLSGCLELSSTYGERIQRGFWKSIAERAAGRTSMDLLSFAAAMQPTDDQGSQRFVTQEPLSVEREADGALEPDDAQVNGSSDGGRYALPDVCLERRADGTQEVLLARVHHHLLVWNWLGAFYPSKPRYERSARRFIEREPTAKNLVSMAFTRRNKGFYEFPGTRVVYSSTEPAVVGAKTLVAGELTVELGERPVLRDPEGRELQLYLPLADFVLSPPYAALAHPLVLHAPIRSHGAHTPRVRIGGAFYQRERWELETAGVARLTGADLVFALRRMARAHALPRFVFARSAHERKPFLVDFASPFSPELLKHLSQGEKLSCEEMFPSPEGLWLRDQRGRYTFELRMQAERWTVPVPE